MASARFHGVLSRAVLFTSAFLNEISNKTTAMTEKQQTFTLSGGYSKVSFWINSFFNIGMSLILIICSLPFMVIISLFILVLDGRPILYRGKRLGIHKSLFTMYKFRTLSPNAQKIIGAQLLTAQVASEINVLTPFGTFLRETRLDELPQLFNILKGDMDFLGPRPERPEIYEKFCRQIKGYDKRFLVKPGLIGYSQLFTPHSSPKRIRTLIDNKFITKKQKLLWDIVFICLTIVVVLGRLFRFGSRFIKSKVLKTFGYHEEKRKFDRVKVDNAIVHVGFLSEGDHHLPIEGRLIDMNEDALLIHAESDFPPNKEAILQMEITIASLHGKKDRKKSALARGSVYKSIKTLRKDLVYTHIIQYTPVSPLNSYMIHQYFLDRSIM